MDRNNKLLVWIAYILIIIIWSTTPLAIKWSSEGLGFVVGITGRMLIGSVIALALVFIWHKKLPLHRAALQVYMASAMAIFGAMMLVYWGAQFIPSGLVSVVFGLTPIFTAWFATHLLIDDKFTLTKFIGALLGVAGLGVIFIDQMAIGKQALWGIVAVLASVIVHSMSAVWIKRLNVKLPALTVTAGGLGFSMPLFLLAYVVLAEPLPTDLPLRSIWAIVYLGVMGSVVGFVSYYFVLARLSASSVALVTLITPVTALWLGNILNQERMTFSILAGTGFVLMGLILHQWSGVVSKHVWQKVKIFSG
ncbi:MAG: DMT family transporter [Gammaproteobacteria bacterium]|nr:DMT family transporter [Gammaproteobacteria bacterium]